MSVCSLHEALYVALCACGASSRQPWPLQLLLLHNTLTTAPCAALPYRTCESLSAEALVVPSRAVLAADAFKKQSRTSERWLRISEVGIPDLPAFLQEQRAAGYTIVGELG